MPMVPYSRRLVLGLEYGAFHFPLSRGATTPPGGLRAGTLPALPVLYR